MAAGRAPLNLELPEFEKKEKARMLRNIEKTSRDVSKWVQQGEDFLDMVNLGGPRIKMKMGDMSDKIWSEGAINPQSDAMLARLPVEVKLNIINALSTRADQVALSVTCKHFAEMDAVHRKQLKEKTASGRNKTYSKINKLSLLVQLRPWVPDRYKLCYNCLRFKLAKTAGWRDNMEITGKKLTNTYALTNGPKCGLCVTALEIQQAKDTAQYKSLAAKMKASVRRT